MEDYLPLATIIRNLIEYFCILYITYKVSAIHNLLRDSTWTIKRKR